MTAAHPRWRWGPLSLKLDKTSASAFWPKLLPPRWNVTRTQRTCLDYCFCVQLEGFFWQKTTTGTHFFTTVCSSRSILFCTRTVGISPTSASTFSFQLSMAWNESLSVVEKTNTHAWAPGMQDASGKRSHFHSYFTKSQFKKKTKLEPILWKPLTKLDFSCVCASAEGYANVTRRSVPPRVNPWGGEGLGVSGTRQLGYICPKGRGLTAVVGLGYSIKLLLARSVPQH